MQAVGFLPNGCALFNKQYHILMNNSTTKKLRGTTFDLNYSINFSTITQ